MLRASGHDVQVWNAGVSSDTFAMMLARLDQHVPNGVKIVILQGGYNDLLRRSDPAWVTGYIQAIVSRLRARNINVVLCGFFYPEWDAVGIAVAQQYGAVFVAGGSCYDSRYLGFDGLHMTATGHQVVATRLLPVVQRLLSRTRRSLMWLHAPGLDRLGRRETVPTAQSNPGECSRATQREI